MKLADNHKSRTVQPQLQAAMAPVQIPSASGYLQSGKAYSSTAPFGYTYPHPVAAYDSTAYPSTAYPSPSAAAAPYPTQSQVLYSQFAIPKDPHGLPTPSPSGMSGYPYYVAKQ